MLDESLIEKTAIAFASRIGSVKWKHLSESGRDVWRREAEIALKISIKILTRQQSGAGNE